MIENLQISIFEFWIIFKTWMVQFHFPSIPGLFHYQMFALSLTSRMVPCSTFVLPGNAMMVLTPFVSLMTTPYMVLVGMLSSRIGGGIMPWNPPTAGTWGHAFHTKYSHLVGFREGLDGWLAPSQTKHRENTEDWMLKIGPGNGPFYKAFCDKEYTSFSTAGKLSQISDFKIWISCWQHDKFGLINREIHNWIINQPWRRTNLVQLHYLQIGRSMAWGCTFDTWWSHLTFAVGRDEKKL